MAKSRPLVPTVRVVRVNGAEVGLKRARGDGAALNERREQAELRLQQLACKMAKAARTGRLDRFAGPDGLYPRPQLAPARCPCSGPRRASAAGAQQPDVYMRSLCSA